MPVYAGGGELHYVQFPEICEKCGNMWNMQQSHICAKLTCLVRMWEVIVACTFVGPRSVTLSADKYQVHEVSAVLKRFLRTLNDSVLTTDLYQCWISASREFTFTLNWQTVQMPSVLWHCWLGSRKGIRPVKKLEQCGGAGVVICLERGADLLVAQLMPLPLTVSCFSKIQIGFTFLVPARPGSSGKRAVKRVCVWQTVQSVYR